MITYHIHNLQINKVLGLYSGKKHPERAISKSCL
jgi:hypothetical protein